MRKEYEEMKMSKIIKKKDNNGEKKRIEKNIEQKIIERRLKKVQKKKVKK